MTAATTTLRGDEYDVVADYAAGATPVEIAAKTGIDLDRVNGVLTRKAGMNRDRARDLVNGGATIATDHAERALASPLTAPITKTAKKPTPAKPTPPPPAPALAEPAAVDWVAISSPNRLNGVPQPEPEVTADLVSQMLDDGIQAIADRLRDLLASLVDAAGEQQRAALVRQRVEDLEAQLEAARAELPTHNGPAGGTP